MMKQVLSAAWSGSLGSTVASRVEPLTRSLVPSGAALAKLSLAGGVGTGVVVAVGAVVAVGVLVLVAVATGVDVTVGVLVAVGRTAGGGVVPSSDSTAKLLS